MLRLEKLFSPTLFLYEYGKRIARKKKTREEYLWPHESNRLLNSLSRRRRLLNRLLNIHLPYNRRCRLRT